MDMSSNPQQDAAASVTLATHLPINEVNSSAINSPQSCKQEKEMTSFPLVTLTFSNAAVIPKPNPGQDVIVENAEMLQSPAVISDMKDTIEKVSS